MEGILDICSLGSKFAICGDMNARTGRSDDTLDICISDNAPTLMNSVSLPEQTMVPPRASMDRGVNSFGHKLVQLCAATGIIILNGRLPGDTLGACTYFSQSVNGSSLIDYFLAYPNLVFNTNGTPLPGASLCVQEHNDFRAISDHLPVLLTLPHGTIPEPLEQPGRYQRK